MATMIGDGNGHGDNIGNDDDRWWWLVMMMIGDGDGYLVAELVWFKIISAGTK